MVEEFDEKSALTNEFNDLARQQETIKQNYESVENALNAGKVGLDEANHARLELRNLAEKNDARMTAINSSLKDVRQSELNALRSEIPGWDSDQGFSMGTKRLQKYLKEQGYPDDFVGKASTKQLKDMEELRQRRTTKKGQPTDFDMQDVLGEVGRQYNPDMTDWDAMAAETGIPAARLQTMKKSDRELMTKDLGDLPK